MDIDEAMGFGKIVVEEHAVVEPKGHLGRGTSPTPAIAASKWYGRFTTR